MLDEVVQQYVQKSMGEKKKKKREEGESESEQDDDNEEPVKGEPLVEDIDSDLYYYSKPDKKYKVFDPRTKKWTAQADKPSGEFIQ